VRIKELFKGIRASARTDSSMTVHHFVLHVTINALLVWEAATIASLANQHMIVLKTTRIKNALARSDTSMTQAKSAKVWECIIIYILRV
jgi:hypothetical protein